MRDLQINLLSLAHLKLTPHSVKTALLFSAFLLCGSAATADAQFANLKEIQERTGFVDYYQTDKQIKPVKIAILDTGFKGYKEAIGKSLPKGTIYHKGVVPPITGTEEIIHGRIMAELVYALLTDSGKSTRFAPAQFHLYNVSGFSNFSAAIDDLIERQIDIVIYSEIWKVGGNWDGKGFINKLVNRAVTSGVIWVNAAGNFGKRTYQSEITFDKENWVILPDSNNSLHVKCEPPAESEVQNCDLRATLLWNDFKDDTEIGTEKDLDFIVTDDTGKIIGASTMKQVLKHIPNQATSLYPREAVNMTVEPGTYFLKVKSRSKNFQATDRLRILVDGDFLTVPNGQLDESLLSPADNRNVITAGASDTDRSSMSVLLSKPDLTTPSRILFSEDGEDRNMGGSSNSAAIVGAGVAILKSVYPDTFREEIVGMLKEEQPSANVGQLQNQLATIPELSNMTSANLLFVPLDGNICYPIATPEQFNLTQWPQFFSEALAAGGKVVSTSRGIKIMTPFDPARFLRSYGRVRFDDVVVLSHMGYALRPRYMVSQLRPYEIEVFQNPSDYEVCQQEGESVAPETDNPGNFRLPTLRD